MTPLSRTRSILTLLLTIGLLAAPLTASAQGPTVAVVVAGSEGAAVHDPLMGALLGRGYSPVPTDTVEAAIAFQLQGQPVGPANAEALRAATGATVLYLVATRPADGGELFFSVHRFDGGAPRAQFGRAAAADLGTSLVQQVLAVEAAGAAPVGQPVPGQAQAGVQVQPGAAGQPAYGQAQVGVQPGQPAGYVQPGQPGYVAQPGQPGYVAQPGQPGYVAQPGQPGYVAQPGQPGYVPQPGQRGYVPQPGQPGYGQPRAGRKRGGGMGSGGAVMLGLGVAGWLATGLGTLLICADEGSDCGEPVGYGFIPIAGPWVLIGEYPALQEGTVVLYIVTGVVQAITIPLGAVFLAIGAARRGRARQPAQRPLAFDVQGVGELSFDFGATPNSVNVAGRLRW